MAGKKRSMEYINCGKDVRLPSGNVIEVKKVASCCSDIMDGRAFCNDYDCDNFNCGFRYVI